MKNKALTLAIAAALSAPASFAATDQSGMRYTSAAEGLYGFVNMRFETKKEKGGKAGFTNTDTAVRLGVRGTNDMGHGLEGFYRWEIERSSNDGSSAGVDNRLGNIGVNGAFGSFKVGSFWTDDLNWIGAINDTAGADSLYYTDEREGRSQEAIQYTTPDLNGFAGSIRLSAGDRGNASETLNLWNLAAKYEVAGFLVGASYNVIPEGGIAGGAAPVCGPNKVLKGPLGSVGYSLNTDNGKIEDGGPALTDACATAATSNAAPAGDADATLGDKSDTKSWTFGLKYAQNNWFVGGLYGVDNTSDNELGVASKANGRKGCGALGNSTRVNANGAQVGTHVANKCEDTKQLGLAAGVTIDKINLAVSWQKTELMDGAEDTTGGVEAVYNFSSQTRVLANYRIQDRDSDKDADNHLRLEMRHSF